MLQRFAIFKEFRLFCYLKYFNRNVIVFLREACKELFRDSNNKTFFAIINRLLINIDCLNDKYNRCDKCDIDN